MDIKELLSERISKHKQLLPDESIREEYETG
jgi:hypothetical protein